jgi:hypothetical protein
MQRAANEVQRYQRRQMGQTIADQENYRNEYGDSADLVARPLDPQEASSYSVQSLIGQDSIEQLKLLLNPSSCVKRYLLILNSVLQDAVLNGTGAIQWTLSYSGQAPGLVQMPADMKHVVGVRYACPFRMLQSTNAYQNVPFPGSHWWSQADTTRNLITIAIEEFRAQSFIGPPYPQASNSTQGALVSPIRGTQNRRFHFIGYQRSVGESGFIIEAPVVDVESSQFGQGFYWFQFPYIPPNTLTLTFGAPFVPCQLYGTVVSGAAEDSGANTLRIWFDQITQFNAEQGYYISGFTTTDPVTDAALIEFVNTALHVNFTNEFRTFPYPNDISAQRGLTFNAIDLTGVTLPAGLVCQVRSTVSVMYTVGLEFYYTTF